MQIAWNGNIDKEKSDQLTQMNPNAKIEVRGGGRLQRALQTDRRRRGKQKQ